MGLIPGLAAGMIANFAGRKEIGIGVGFSLLGVVVGMLFASLTEIMVSGIDMNTALVGYFLPAFVGNAVVIVILLPILMIAYNSIVGRLGR